jgi:isopentenyl phosphate kinase
MIFVKLGGSLITDKGRPYTARREVIARLGKEVRQALDAAPDLRLLIGHGSGSYGHWAAKPHGTRQGVRTPAQWHGYAEVAGAAARLNRIVSDALIDAGVPVLSVQPSASARCHDGTLIYLDTYPLHAALAHSLVPLIYGDVALDDTRGGTIISTEDIFTFLVDELSPTHILLLGEVDGVLGSGGAAIPTITPGSFPDFCNVLTGSAGVDVTGGMADKVARMIKVVQRYPKIQVRVFSGTEPGLLTKVLLNPTVRAGTLVVRDSGTIAAR